MRNFCGIIFLFPLLTYSQPKNSGTIQNCDRYIFNEEKVNVKFNSKKKPYKITEVCINKKNDVRTSVWACKNELVVELDETMEEVILKNLNRNFSITHSTQSVKLMIEDWGVRKNPLPEDKKDLYLAIDILIDHNNEDQFKLIYSRTHVTNVGTSKFIERPFATLLKEAFTEFFSDHEFYLSMPFNSGKKDRSTFNFYSSFHDLDIGNATFSIDGNSIKDEFDKSRRYHLKANGLDAYALDHVVGYERDGELFLNTLFYYPPYDYFVKITPISEDYYLALDFVHGAKDHIDLIEGFIETLDIVAPGDRRLPILVNRSNGEMTFLFRRELIKLFDQSSTYSFEDYRESILTEKYERVIAMFLSMSSEGIIIPGRIN